MGVAGEEKCAESMLSIAHEAGFEKIIRSVISPIPT